MRSFLMVVSIATSAVAFTPFGYRSVATRRSNLYMGGANKFATSKAGKVATVERINGLLQESEMIFTIPAGSLTVSEVQTLRREVPETTTVSVVKNTLMSRALEGTEYGEAASLLKGPNMWFFIEDDIAGTIKALKSFSKEYGKKESHPVLGGVMEGILYDEAGVGAIGELPSKDELYAKIAGSIKAVPTKVARVIKAPNSKLARAIKLATMPEDDDE